MKLAHVGSMTLLVMASCTTTKPTSTQAPTLPSHLPLPRGNYVSRPHSIRLVSPGKSKELMPSKVPDSEAHRALIVSAPFEFARRH